MKNKRIILLLTTSVIALLVYIFVSCKKEFTCITVADREECKKKCKIGTFSTKKYRYNDVNNECCCVQ